MHWAGGGAGVVVCVSQHALGGGVSQHTLGRGGCLPMGGVCQGVCVADTRRDQRQTPPHWTDRHL